MNKYFMPSQIHLEALELLWGITDGFWPWIQKDTGEFCVSDIPKIRHHKIPKWGEEASPNFTPQGCVHLSSWWEPFQRNWGSDHCGRGMVLSQISISISISMSMSIPISICPKYPTADVYLFGWDFKSHHPHHPLLFIYLFFLLLTSKTFQIFWYFQTHF